MYVRSTVQALAVISLFFVCHFCYASGQLESITSINKSSDAGFQVEPAPKWILPAPTESGGQIPRASMHYALIDEQDQFDSRGVASYRHIIRVVNDTEGLSPAAEIQIKFDPAYETLVFHNLEIWRNGVRINKFDPNKVRLLQREGNLESQMYDGTITAVVVLDDVRVGDRIDYGYSIRGMNPVFEGKYVRTTWMGSGKGPTMIARFRLLAPESRHVFHKIGAGTTVRDTIHDGMRDTEFLRVSVPQIHGDQYTPVSAYLGEQLNLSEFEDWGAVADWGAKLYSAALNTSSDQVKKTAESIGAMAATSPLERLRLALNFVQKDVRYFGTEIGENSHRPSYPDAVIKQRFGDCKDKAALLIALLSELGINASPVLVSTQLRNNIDPSFPTPLVFNHVITRVEIDDKVYWLDGTRAGQTGPLAQRQSVGLGKGLVLSAGAAHLTDLPGTDDEERVTVEEILKVKKLSQAPNLELRITYFGEMAEFLRSTIASQPIAMVEIQLNAEFARFHPNVQKAASMRIEEVPDQNAIRIVQIFTAPKYWSYPDQSKLVGNFTLWNLIIPLRYPEEASRQQVFQINLPGVYRHTVTLEFSEDMANPVSFKQVHEEDPHLNFQIAGDVDPGKVQVRGELRLLKDNVTPTEWPAYTNFLRKLLPRFDGTFDVPSISDVQRAKLESEINDQVASWQGIFARNKPTTSVQAHARVRRLFLTAQLEGDRLNPELRAQALHARGIELDNLGLSEMATADFEEALKLTPNDASILADIAVNYFQLGRDELALEYAKKALARAPSDDQAQSTLAHTFYFDKNYAEAKNNLLVLLKNRNQINQGYAAIWLYLVARRNNEDAVTTVKPYLANNQSAWPHPILKFLMGSGTFEKALEAAKEGQKDPSKLCELYFYAGEKYLVDGQIDRARELFKKSIDTGVVEFNEYTFSKRSLKLLDNL